MSKSGMIELMKKHGIPLTMANWLGLEFPDGPPEGWEQDLDVPDELQEEYSSWLQDN